MSLLPRGLTVSCCLHKSFVIFLAGLRCQLQRLKMSLLTILLLGTLWIPPKESAALALGTWCKGRCIRGMLMALWPCPGLSSTASISFDLDKFGLCKQYGFIVRTQDELESFCVPLKKSHRQIS